VKQEEKKGTLKLFFGKKKKQARPKKIIYFSLQCITVFSTVKKSIRLTGKLIFDCYFHTEYFNSDSFLNFNTIVIKNKSFCQFYAAILSVE
jgi:hypothetical protein